MDYRLPFCCCRREVCAYDPDFGCGPRTPPPALDDQMHPEPLIAEDSMGKTTLTPFSKWCLAIVIAGYAAALILPPVIWALVPWIRSWLDLAV